jgi:isoaspartyl peptidase/L-asparaginase-like protein (Ntn-hydrolase superfamily)
MMLGGCQTTGEPADQTQHHAVLPAARRDAPVVISTWNHGLAANESAMKVLLARGRAFDAVEVGVRVSESDPHVHSVGLGGLPNAEGVVQLDAAIMDGPSARAGAVAALEEIEHPVSVARKVMEETPHVLLVGPGAQQFALKHGFPRVNLLTDEAVIKWKQLKEKARAGHDTIGMCALDAEGNLAVACTTSGLANKLPGRVGDSPLVGLGLFVDNEVGAAVATGIGEEVMQTAGSFLVVENMHHGMTPMQACRDVVERILRKHPAAVEGQVAFLALRRDGEIGAYSLQQDFNYAHFDGRQNQLRTSEYAVYVPRPE